MNALWKNINLCFRFFALSCLIIKGTDALPVSNLGCEIQKAKSLSPDYEDPNTVMVDPYSMVNRTCLIKNGGTTLGKTWEQVNNISKAKSDLVLKSGNLTTRICLTRPLEATYRSPSPRTLYPEEERKMSCRFKGWPIPRVVWFKDDKTVINGTNGFYHTEKLLENHQNTLETSLYIPSREENEGFYKCAANNNICGRSSERSLVMQVIYMCPIRIDSEDSKTAKAIVFSNSTLRCLVQDQHELCDLKWVFSNKTLPSKSSDKYKIELIATPSKCKKEFSLTVMNVTFADEGTYSCHQLCGTWFNSSAFIELNVGPSPTRSNEITDSVLERSKTGPSPTRSNEITDSVLERSKTGDQLLISYSPKDSAWVAENVTSLLDEHSVNYELQQSIHLTVVDSVLDHSRQMLIVLSKEDLASNFCQRKGWMSNQLRALDKSNSRVILVSIGQIPESQSQSLSCLGETNLLEFKEQKKQDWQKSLLDAVRRNKIARR